MNFPLLRKNRTELPGTTLVVRRHRSFPLLLTRVEPGDLVVIDQLDLGVDAARALLDRRPGAVLNASAFISGRYPNLGPRVLTEAGVPLYEARREDVLALRDGAALRLHEDTLHDGVVVVLDLDRVHPEQVLERMAAAESGLAVQLESFAHAASELVRREEGVLLHGRGIPVLQTRLRDRAALVVGPAARPEELRSLRRWIQETRPAVIAVDAGVEVSVANRVRPDVAVLSGSEVVADKPLRRAREVVLADQGTSVRAQAERLNLPTSVVATSLAPLDVGLLLAHGNDARLVVAVGGPAGIEEFVDRDRNDQASAVLTRLRLGTRGVAGAVVPLVQRRRRRLRPVLGGVAAVAVLTSVLAFSPPGQDLVDAASSRLPDGWGNPEALERAQSQVAERERQVAALSARARNADAYAEATGPATVRGSLAGRAVSLLLLPGADPATVAAVTALVGSAGGQVTGTLTLLPPAVAPSQAGLVDALTSQLLTQATDVRTPAGASGAERLGALLARSAGLPSAARLVRGAYDATAVSIVSGLGAADLLAAKVTARAALTLVVAGEPSAADEVLAPLVAAYGAQVPTVVAAPSADGVLGLLREGRPTFGTVSGTAGTPGRVAAVLALAARTRGQAGSYGLGAGEQLPPLP